MGEQKHAAKVEKRKEIKRKLKEMKLPEKGAEGSSTPTKKKKKKSRVMGGKLVEQESGADGGKKSKKRKHARAVSGMRKTQHAEQANSNGNEGLSGKPKKKKSKQASD